MLEDTPPISPSGKQSQQQKTSAQQLFPLQAAPLSSNKGDTSTRINSNNNNNNYSNSSSLKALFTHSSTPSTIAISSKGQERNRQHKPTALSEPNSKWMAVESPIKRKIQTSSTVASAITSLFIVTPTRIDFGRVYTGC